MSDLVLRPTVVSIPLFEVVLMITVFVIILVERVFKFVGSVPQGDDVKKKDLLVRSLHYTSCICYLL